MIGQFVTSRAGHDRGTLYVILAEEGDFVYLSDGCLKPVEHPKRKRWRHIQRTGRMVEEPLLGKLCCGERVYNEEIKYAIKKYAQQ